MKHVNIYIHTDILFCIHIVFRFIFDHDFANPTNLLIGGYHFLNSTFGNYNNICKHFIVRVYRYQSGVGTMLMFCRAYCRVK